MDLPAWLTFQTVTPYVLSIPGWYAAWRNFRMDRVILRFSFDVVQTVDLVPGTDPNCVSEAINTSFRCTVTNDGRRPFTVARLDFKAAYGSFGQDTIEGASLNLTLGQGQSHIFQIGAGAVSVTLVDSAGQSFRPNKREQQVLKDATEAYGKGKAFRNPDPRSRFSQWWAANPKE